MKETIDLHQPTMRVLKILECVDRNPQGLSLTEISKTIGSPKSTIYPILNTLLENGYLKLNRFNNYVIGLKTFQIGLSYSANLGGIDIIRKEMIDIVDECKEICQLGMLVGDQVYYLEKVEPDQAIKILSYTGKYMPAYCTGLGKALLSFLDNKEIEKMYDGFKFEKFTEKTITNIKELLKEVENVRKIGFAYDNQEAMLHASCIAVPINMNTGYKLALSVTYPIFRGTEEKINSIKTNLKSKAKLIEEISKIHKIEIS
ncbi:MAG: IclR family transcriptional regulator [Miniphocaeibacter sp.]|uniref:IclR family transcriptional regulator n=1 Tax=Miniphocaeibacter sp. TaxID=3100973 RepID=UPI00184E3264|nr:IclR family transcriptional regulator [Gallicola sp.]